MFVLGSPINRGIFGEPPSLSSLDSNGNLKYTIDFRSVYATVLDRWKDGDRSLADDWDDLRLDQQRALVAAAFASLVIGPSDPHGPRRFDSRRLTMERRF